MLVPGEQFISVAVEQHVRFWGQTFARHLKFIVSHRGGIYGLVRDVSATAGASAGHRQMLSDGPLEIGKAI